MYSNVSSELPRMTRK